MRIAIIGAAAAAMLGGSLAALPISSVSTPLPTGGTCGGGVQCERLASVLMPETPAPAAPPPPAPAPPPQTPFTGAANVIAPGQSPQPSAAQPSVGGAPSATRAEPGVAGPGVYNGSGGAPAAAAPLPGMPVLPGDVLDQIGGVPNVNTLISIAALPYEATAAATVLNGVVGAGAGVVGIGTGIVGTVTSLAIALTYLHNLGLLPNISLPGPGFSLPALQAAAANIPAIQAAASNLPAIQAAAANIPAIQAAIANLPAAGANVAQIQAFLAAVPKPGLPALPGPGFALPGPGLALPGVPLGPPPIPGPGFCVPVPLGFCAR